MRDSVSRRVERARTLDQRRSWAAVNSSYQPARSSAGSAVLSAVVNSLSRLDSQDTSLTTIRTRGLNIRRIFWMPAAYLGGEVETGEFLSATGLVDTCPDREDNVGDELSFVLSRLPAKSSDPVIQHAFEGLDLLAKASKFVRPYKCAEARNPVQIAVPDVLPRTSMSRWVVGNEDRVTEVIVSDLALNDVWNVDYETALCPVRPVLALDNASVRLDTRTPGVSVRFYRYLALRQSGKHRRTASRSGPGALSAQGHRPVLAVDNASVRLAHSHVHTGFAERLRPDARVTVRPRRYLAASTG